MTYVITWTVPVLTAVPPDGRDRVARTASYQILILHCFIVTLKRTAIKYRTLFQRIFAAYFIRFFLMLHNVQTIFITCEEKEKIDRQFDTNHLSLFRFKISVHFIYFIMVHMYRHVLDVFIFKAHSLNYLLSLKKRIVYIPYDRQPFYLT